MQEPWRNERWANTFAQYWLNVQYMAQSHRIATVGQISEKINAGYNRKVSEHIVNHRLLHIGLRSHRPVRPLDLWRYLDKRHILHGGKWHVSHMVQWQGTHLDMGWAAAAWGAPTSSFGLWFTFATFGTGREALVLGLVEAGKGLDDFAEWGDFHLRVCIFPGPGLQHLFEQGAEISCLIYCHCASAPFPNLNQKGAIQWKRVHV